MFFEIPRKAGIFLKHTRRAKARNAVVSGNLDWP
jgi:hypothetical protein